MTYILKEMGPMGLLDVLILIFIIVFGIYNGYLLIIKRSHENLSQLGRSINSMLFWGAIIVILGFLGTFIGLQCVFQSMEGADADIGNLRVLFGGILMLMKLPILSLTSFAAIAIIWHIYTSRYRRLLERSMKEKHMSN
jgi:hypothetical protein